MKIIFFLVAILAWEIQADEQTDLNRRSKIVQNFKSYIVGIFEESGEISNGDCDYFSGLGTFSNNRDIFKLSRLLNSWMCDSPITKLLAEIAEGTSQLMQMFLKAVEKKPKEETKITITETPITTAKILAKEEMVLYVGSEESEKHVDIYDLVDDSKGFTLRASQPTSGQKWLVTDAANKHLIVVFDTQLDVFNLNGGTGKPTIAKSNIFQKEYGCALWDNNGKYLLASDTGRPADMNAMELKADGSLTIIATYTPKNANDMYTRVFVVHPNANGILAIPYTESNAVKFLRFDSETNTIELLWLDVPVTSVRWVVFSTDGQYMYAAGFFDIISAFKITLDSSKTDVIKIEFIGTFGTSQAPSFNKVMVVSPSGKFLYELSTSTNKVNIYAIDQLSGNLTPNGDQPTGGSKTQFMAMSPKGTKLAVADSEKGVFVFDIKEDGTLEQPKLIPDTKQPKALLFTKK